jgi:hypothetical protein
MCRKVAGEKKGVKPAGALLNTPVTSGPEAATRCVEEGEREWSRRRVQFAWPFRGASCCLTAAALVVVVAAVLLRLWRR